MIALVLSVALAAPCPDADRELMSAEGDIVSFFLADADKTLGDVVASFECGPPATTEQVTRLWLAQGMIWHLGEDPRAPEAFRAARRADPDFWVADYGDEAQQMVDAIEASTDQGAIDLRSNTDETVWLDGQAVALPLDVSAGYHLVQVGDGQTARFARIVEVGAGQTVTVSGPEAEGGGIEISSGATASAPVPEPEIPTAPITFEPSGPGDRGRAVYLTRTQAASMVTNAAGGVNYQPQANISEPVCTLPCTLDLEARTHQLSYATKTFLVTPQESESQTWELRKNRPGNLLIGGILLGLGSAALVSGGLIGVSSEEKVVPFAIAGGGLVGTVFGGILMGGAKARAVRRK